MSFSQVDAPDLVLMDVSMPIMDGFEATRKLRALEKEMQHQHIIIALTGNALQGDENKCLEAGMDDFLSKPYSYDQLKEMLTRYHT